MGLLLSYPGITVHGFTIIDMGSEYIVEQEINSASCLRLTIPKDINLISFLSFTIMRSKPDTIITWVLGDNSKSEEFLKKLNIDELLCIDAWIIKLLSSEHYYRATVETFYDLLCALPS